MDKDVSLDKHKRYRDKYGENEIFWGFGIENETYLQFSKPLYVAAPIIRSARKPERYSVSYYGSYRSEALCNIDKLFPDSSGFFPIPLLMNAHSFTKMDTNGNHSTTYTKLPLPNRYFSGRTLFQELENFYPKFFVNKKEEAFTFDGDTIEFITQNFYKGKISTAIHELIQYKQEFLKKMNEFIIENKIFQDKGTLIYPPKNPAFAVFYSNPSNIAMFNNGTYHINITLPSMLTKKFFGIPTLADPQLFLKEHRNCIRVYQWLEPLLIAIYGTPDPIGGSKASQRCAISRYIGIGTYDTANMPEGKILTCPIDKVRGSDQEFWWYRQYHANSAYTPLTQIGMDVNYKKHYLHGIELRIFDWFPEEKLSELCEFLVYAAEASLLHNYVFEPAMSRIWNGMVCSILENGKDYSFLKSEIGMLEYVLQMSIPKLKVSEVYEHIYKSMKKKFRNGNLARSFLLKRYVC